jgi:tRNA U34 5-methylaminomethyl-2-thiouridine-forming methyltransferase MnmC
MTEIIVTKDGSHSLLNTDLNETYHSVHGALNESVHVFIKQGLEHFLASAATPEVKILEIGFGTGLNALLSLRFSGQADVNIEYTSLEAFPLDKNIWSRLNYADTLSLQEDFNRLHRAPWGERTNISEKFVLVKQQTTLQQIALPESMYDVIYFDAFAPNKQPEMWTLEMLDKVAQAMKPCAVFVTYCAKGQLKRDLKSIGLIVETLPGPPGKKEMVRARK